MNTYVNAFTVDFDLDLPTDLFQATGSRIADQAIDLLDSVVAFTRKLNNLPMHLLEKYREQVIFNGLHRGHTGHNP